MFIIDDLYFVKIASEFNDLLSLSREDALKNLYAIPVTKPINIDHCVLDNARLLVFKAMQHLWVLDSLDAWLIGSCLDDQIKPKDVDILFTVSDGATPPKIRDMEKLFWVIIKSGAEKLEINFDLMFRYKPEMVCGGELNPDHITSTWLLEWPTFKRKIKNKTIDQFRRFGLLSIMITKTAKETNYYSKLHQLESGRRYLRPAKAIVFNREFHNFR